MIIMRPESPSLFLGALVTGCLSAENYFFFDDFFVELFLLALEVDFFFEVAFFFATGFFLGVDFFVDFCLAGSLLGFGSAGWIGGWP